MLVVAEVFVAKEFFVVVVVVDIKAFVVVDSFDVVEEVVDYNSHYLDFDE
jgi:hypothetical protein